MYFIITIKPVKYIQTSVHFLFYLIRFLEEIKTALIRF